MSLNSKACAGMTGCLMLCHSCTGGELPVLSDRLIYQSIGPPCIVFSSQQGIAALPPL